jgi:GT2 family glycosyltransferase
MSDRRRCDVVIATRDRPAALRRCLDGLRAQTEPRFRVIVVDDSSDTPIDSVLSSDDRRGLDLQTIRLAQSSGPAAARNAGVELSDAPYICFVDDDVYANPEFLAAHLDAVTQPHDPAHPIVSCGAFYQPGDWKPTPWNLWEARQARKEAENVINGVYEVTWRQFHTGNNCLPRELFVSLGGFNVSFKRAEDDEFALRLENLGCRFHFEQHAIAWHYSNRSLESWLSIPAAYAYHDAVIDRLYPDVGYLADKRAELARRRWPLRAARLTFGGKRRELGVRFAVTAARLLHRWGFVEPAMGALSVAYDLRYVRSLEESLSRPQSAGGS